MKTTYKIFTVLLIVGGLFSCGNSDDIMTNDNESNNSSDIISMKLSDFYAEAPDSSWILRVQFNGDLYF